MIDPPREEAKQATQCKEAGIIPVMITGDHKGTKKAIAMMLELLFEDDLVLTGSKLSSLTDQEFECIVEKFVFMPRRSRTEKKIIKALQAKGQFVAMTGDGIMILRLKCQLVSL
jgi:Ca2+-transporting ATPase